MHAEELPFSLSAGQGGRSRERKGEGQRGEEKGGRGGGRQDTLSGLKQAAGEEREMSKTV